MSEETKWEGRLAVTDADLRAARAGMYVPREPPLAERIIEMMRKITAAQEAGLRKIALALLGEETGDPEELMRRLQERIRQFAGPKASLVLCEVGRAYLSAGVLGEWYLAIDTGEEGTVPVRIGPPYRVLDGGVAP